MEIKIYEKPEDLWNALDSIVKAKSWDKLTVKHLESLIHSNLRLITQQTEQQNPQTEKLQETLFALSKRIDEVFTDQEARNLALEVSGIAQGILVKGSKVDWSDRYLIPKELQKKILSYLPHELLALDFKKSLKEAALVSKSFHEAALEEAHHWETEMGLFKKRGCTTAKEAVSYIIKHNLSWAVLTEFDDVTDDVIKELIEKKPDLECLILRSQLTNLPLEKLTKLQFMVLDCPNLPGDKLTEDIGKLSRLKMFSLNSSNIAEDNLVAMLQKLTNLQCLELIEVSQNINMEKFYDSLEKLTSLNILSLHSGQITNAIARPLSKLKLLQKLDLSSCGLTEHSGDLMSVIGSLPLLRTLDLSNTRIAQLITKDNELSLGKLVWLQNLGLRGCFQLLAYQYAPNLSPLTRLQNLDLRNTNLNHKTLASFLGNLTQLQELQCTNSGDADILLTPISKLKSLKNLKMPGSFNENHLLETLRNLPLLERLEIHDYFTNSEKLAECLSLLKNLRSLILFYGDNKILNVLDHLSSLETLNLKGKVIKPEDVEMIFEKLPFLEKLIIDSRFPFTEEQKAKFPKLIIEPIIA